LLVKLVQPAHARAEAVWKQREEDERRRWAIQREERRRRQEEEAAERRRKWEEEHPEQVAAEAELRRKRAEQERLDRISKPHRFEYSNDTLMPTPWVRNDRNGVQALSTRKGLLVVTPADPLDLDAGWTVTKHRDDRPEPRVLIKGVSQERAFEV